MAQPANHPSQVADAVSVGVLEGARVDLEDDAALPPHEYPGPLASIRVLIDVLVLVVTRTAMERGFRAYTLPGLKKPSGFRPAEKAVSMKHSQRASSGTDGSVKATSSSWALKKEEEVVVHLGTALRIVFAFEEAGHLEAEIGRRSCSIPRLSSLCRRG